MRVLIADDSEILRNLLVRILARIGIEDVESAIDGQEAIDAVSRSDFDLLLIDWSMPNVQGIDAIKEIRSRGKTMPIIVISSQYNEDLVQEALASGANDYIAKPFRVDMLLQRIKLLLR